MRVLAKVSITERSVFLLISFILSQTYINHICLYIKKVINMQKGCIERDQQNICFYILASRACGPPQARCLLVATPPIPLDRVMTLHGCALLQSAFYGQFILYSILPYTLLAKKVFYSSLICNLLAPCPPILSVRTKRR